MKKALGTRHGIKISPCSGALLKVSFQVGYVRFQAVLAFFCLIGAYFNTPGIPAFTLLFDLFAN